VLSQHFQVLRALAALRESEVRVVLVGGNHDAWGGAFLEREVGMELVDGPVEMILGGRKALVAHGDGIGPGDTGYKILKRTLRSRAVRRLMRWVHPDLAGRIVRLISHTGVMSEERLRKSRETARVLEEEATRLLSLRPDLELVVFGHCHVPRLKQVGARAYYVNSGDWLVNRTYTLVTAESIEQLEWQEPFTAQPAGASQ
jgi:UDP-2,3-diacylglucosamine hydrolase